MTSDRQKSRDSGQLSGEEKRAGTKAVRQDSEEKGHESEDRGQKGRGTRKWRADTRAEMDFKQFFGFQDDRDCCET